MSGVADESSLLQMKPYDDALTMAAVRIGADVAGGVFCFFLTVRSAPAGQQTNGPKSINVCDQSGRFGALCFLGGCLDPAHVRDESSTRKCMGDMIVLPPVMLVSIFSFQASSDALSSLHCACKAF